MSFVERELEKIRVAMSGQKLNSLPCQQLWAARQALEWALEPTGFASPTEAVSRERGGAFKVKTTDIPVASEGCPEQIHHSVSSS